MADNDNNPSLAHFAARQSIRQAFLTDFDARAMSAGGVDAFLYTAPQRELDWMLQRSDVVLSDAELSPEESVSSQVAMERVHGVVAVIEDEMAAREMVAQEAVGPSGELAYHLPEEAHLRSQETLARHLAYHEARLSAPDYKHGEGFDHVAAASTYRKHLLAQQLDAYDRQLDIVPSKETQFVLGSQLHDRATRAVLDSQTTGDGVWNQWTVADRLGEHHTYLLEGIDQHRQFRADLARDSDEGVYPGDLPVDMEAAWDAAAIEVDAAVDRANGRERAPEHVAAAEETVDIDAELQHVADGPLPAAERLTAAQRDSIERLTVAAARSYQGIGEPLIEHEIVEPRVLEYSAADDTPGTVYVRLSALVTPADDPELARDQFYHQTGYVGVEPDGLIRAVSTGSDEALARAAQRNDRRLNVAEPVASQLEWYEAELQGDRGSIRYEARSAKGIRDHFGLEEEFMGNPGLLRVASAQRVVDLYTEQQRAEALEPAAATGVDPVADEAGAARWRAQLNIAIDWHERAERVGGDERLLATASDELLTEFAERINQVGTAEALAPVGDDNSATIRRLADQLEVALENREIGQHQEFVLDQTVHGPILGAETDTIYSNPDLEHLSGLQVAEGIKAAGLDDSIANRLSEEQLQGVHEWASEQAWVAQREFAPAQAEEWAEISQFAQAELGAREVAAEQHYSHSPARDAYMGARVEAGVVGAALADPRMKLALDLAGLKDQHARTASTLTPGYDAGRKPPFWRARQRAEWQAQKPIAEALEANSERQERLREQIGPDADSLAKQARDLVEVRNELVGKTAELQRNAIDEELARQPEWLSNTLGPRPETGAARWQSLASDLAANRLRYGVTEDADAGIRPDQTMLADKVSQFRTEVGLAQAAGPLVNADLGFGM